MHANTQPKGRAKLIIYKRKRRLELWLGDACHAVYPVALGFASSGPKQSEGDGRTPEGTYAICTRNAQSRFYLSLGISYPNAADAQKALEQGRIDETAYQRIVLAHRAQRRPPWDTPLGGAMGARRARYNGVDFPLDRKNRRTKPKKPFFTKRWQKSIKIPCWQTIGFRR